MKMMRKLSIQGNLLVGSQEYIFVKVEKADTKGVGECCGGAGRADTGTASSGATHARPVQAPGVSPADGLLQTVSPR